MHKSRFFFREKKTDFYCRAFQTRQAAAKHVFLWHENFKATDEENKRLKYETLLKKEVDVRVTNLSRLLTNEVTPSKIMEAAKEFVRKRVKGSASPQTKLIKVEQETKPNFHVSEVCEHCVPSEENFTAPNTHRNLI